ncbi:putative inorganic carbon transporter subunit DabA, partial [Arsukibacterium sp.]|uniref:putative inorganic carbon transporter subunit DabA n=1 Tax=Arsukibacterium sp. TaxID=1977258 RepID=UPI00299F32D7
TEPAALLQQLEPWLDSWCDDEQTKLAYLENLLQGLSGWAGWQAWLDWQQQLNQQQSHNAVSQLLYMLLGWDWVLWQHSKRHNETHQNVVKALKLQSRQYSTMLLNTRAQQSMRQVWQRALELSFQLPLLRQLQQAASQPAALPARPVLQAAFCIDVRSEPIRRMLEQQHKGIQTLGFAGFFGLPIAYKAADSKLSRPQLPGLLAPVMQVSQVRPDKATLPRQPALGWKQSFDLASSSLGMVEAAGATKLLSLLKRAFFRTKAPHAMNRYLDDGKWQLSHEQQPLSVREQAQLAAAILSAMGLSSTLAPVVLLVGHGSNTCNNPQAAALDCGACGGQTGEVNVKVLAQILNDNEVRAELAWRHELEIPADTRFHAAMHHTTTDDLQVFSPPADADWLSWLADAATDAKQQRASQFAEAPAGGSALSRFFKLRSRDWAQLRPEWGLANNAAFIVAPRALTKGLDLQGRCFLHDYDAARDDNFSLLHTIMTAPMVVTNWINMQYYASVVAPDKYGSGNKLLHNVVAGHIGVFEGNGGDLRTGLSWQSVHDGSRLRHQPVRLTVIIAAPQQAISDIITRAGDVAALVNNQWLWLYQLDQDGTLHQWKQMRWQKVTL